MKKLFFAAAVLALGITSCQKTDINDNVAGGENFVTVCAALPADMYGTRAAGEGAEVNRCIMEIYLDGVRYGEPAVAALVDKKAQFSARLISGKTYDLVFWADAAKGTGVDDFEDNHYDTSSLTNVTVKDASVYAGNDDTRDAFFASEKLFVEMSTNVNVQLRRPFGQLNVKTNDMADVRAANIADLVPTHVSIAYKSVPMGINLLTGELTEAADALVYADKAAVIDENGTLSMDYIFAPKGEEQYLADFTMSFINASGTKAAADYEFTNIPVQRNYRTNVSGNLLTKKTDINIEVVPDFDGEIDHEITEVATVAEANAALESGAKNIVIAVAPEQAETVVIPHNYTDSDVALSLTLPATTEQITVSYGDKSANAPKIIAITAASAENLVIETDASTVGVNGVYRNVSSTTADNTLIVAEDASIETLTLVKGNAKLYGTVNKVVKADGYASVIYRCFDTQKSFDNLVADDKSGYTEILVDHATEAIDAKNATLTRQLTVAAPATIANIKIVVDYKDAYGLKIVNGATKVAMDNFVISSTKTADRTAWIECENAVCTFTNGKFIVPTGTEDKSGLNLSAYSGKADMDITLDNVLISTSEEPLNVDKKTDYQYSAEQKNAVPSYSRGITFGYLCTPEETATAKMKVTMRNSAIEGLYYNINVVQCATMIDFTAENCVFDGRASLNLWGRGASSFYMKNSKLIGRNWFGGPTEDFATLVYNWASDEMLDSANQTVVLDGCDVVSDNDPQTDTNHQFMASMRSRKHNKLEMKNGTKFREVTNPRLTYAVQMHFPEACEVVWDDTFKLECAEGATVLEPEPEPVE